MSEQESFVARWLRLKQESDAAAPSVPAAPAPADRAAPAPFDPSCLPSIESITRESDISLFLQSGVPAELVRAALRAVWVADPAIRDFIGIAESQWDFNDPTAMPGFGPLHAADQAQSLIARAVSRGGEAGVSPRAISDTEALPVPESINPARGPQVEAAAAGRAPDNDRANRVRREPAIVEDQPLGRRRHGSAMPKVAQ